MESRATVGTSKQSAGWFGLRCLVLGMVLSVLVLLPCGCASWGERPGMTKAEVRRQQKRTMRIDKQEMLADIDRVLGLDKPSGLTDKRIP